MKLNYTPHFVWNYSKGPRKNNFSATDVAHALVRAASRFLSTLARAPETKRRHESDAARTSACATWPMQPM
jgi:hypothetical protein